MKFNKTAVVALVLVAVAAGAVYAVTMGDGGVEDSEHNITVANNDDSVHTVQVRVGSSNDEVINTTEEVSPGEDWDVATQTDAGDYELLVTTSDGRTGEDEYTLPLAKDGYDSFSKIRINDTGAVDIQTYWQE